MNGEETNALVGPLDSDVAIKSRIFTIRGVQVILDWDIAQLYGVETRVLNQAVKRNLDRFPERFRFVLTKEEMLGLITNCDKFGSKRHYPGNAAAFTEQGVAMLSAVLRSPLAVDISIKIMDAFIAMRHFVFMNEGLLQRMDAVEIKQVTMDEKLNKVLKAMDGGEFPPQKVFFDGRHYEAYSFAKKLVGKATKSILLVDGYCDDVTLDILSAKRCGVKVTVATVEKTPITDTAIAKFNKQNPTLEVRHTGRFHDRFLVIDDKELYHFGASLKDLGRHYCAVSKMDAAFIPSILKRM